jgi:RNA polymerase sigma-70 factor, ECF subfamily
MAPDASFAALMTRLRTGDPDAARAVFDRFARRLVALARTRLDERTGRKEDPEDVLQSVFRSFFTRYRGGQFEVTDWDSLWGLLTVITLRKCGNRIAYYHAARRDVGREVGPGHPDGPAALGQAVAREPTPEEAAVLAETLTLVMRRLEPYDREILVGHLQGDSADAIGARVGRARRTVRRALERIRQMLERVQAGEEFLETPGAP